MEKSAPAGTYIFDIDVAVGGSSYGVKQKLYIIVK